MKIRYLKYRLRRRTVWLDGGSIEIPAGTVNAIRKWLDSFVYVA
jgi:hypothetical protein